MKYNFFLILLIVLITSCAPNNYKTVNVDPIFEKFSNNGFALIYNDKLYNDKIISKKMDERDLIIFQRNLRKGNSVKITNPLNSKTIIAKVGKKANYPSFNNSVVSIRISKEYQKTGYGKKLLNELFEEAKKLNISKISVETGSGEFFLPARKLFLSSGFNPCKPFAHYTDDPNSKYYNKYL